jgi:hypothetical protein
MSMVSIGGTADLLTFFADVRLASVSISQEVGLAAFNLEAVRHRCLRLERIGDDDREAERP